MRHYFCTLHCTHAEVLLRATTCYHISIGKSRSLNGLSSCAMSPVMKLQCFGDTKNRGATQRRAMVLQCSALQTTKLTVLNFNALAISMPCILQIEREPHRKACPLVLPGAVFNWQRQTGYHHSTFGCFGDGEVWQDQHRFQSLKRYIETYGRMCRSDCIPAST